MHLHGRSSTLTAAATFHSRVLLSHRQQAQWRRWHRQLCWWLHASLHPGSPSLQGAAAAQSAGGAEGLAVAAERFQEALAAKDELLAHLDGELAERKRQAAAYEGR